MKQNNESTRHNLMPLPHDAMQSAVIPQYVVCLSVHLSIQDV